MNLITKQALFGGTLFAAGIAAFAEAQFIEAPGTHHKFTYTRVTLFTYSDGFFGGAGGYLFSTSLVDLDALQHPELGGTAGSILSYSYIGAYLNITAGTSGLLGYGKVRAHTTGYFKVAYDVTVQIDWDFTGYSDESNNHLSQPRPSAFIFLHDKTNSSHLFERPGLGTSGSVSIDLFADDLYYARVYIRDHTASTMWASITPIAVPTPGVFALLGVAVLGVRRRRQQESQSWRTSLRSESTSAVRATYGRLLLAES